MALDYSAALHIKPPEIEDPQISYARALANRAGEQRIDENALILEDTKAKAQAARDQRMKDAQVSKILANSPSPYDAINSIYSVDPNKAHDLASKNADTAMRLIQGVSSYQALNSIWPTVQKYVGPQELPQFASQDEFNQWKREQALAHVDAKTYLEQTKPSAQASKTREVTVTNPDGSTTIKIVKDEPGQEFSSAVKPASTANPTETTLAIAAAKGDKDAMKALQLLKPPKEAGAAGPKPKSVTSGDANKIGDFNDSLRTVGVLADTISGVAGATGNAAAIGAALPNFVTNITGWGVTAKEKQAVIDRVKQVIGKSLEGGVLRKEDEDKYKKILPVISDPPEVVTSKLNGLKQAIEQKREEHLSALEDAGYDTTKFRARVEAGGTKKPADKAVTPKKIGRFMVEVD